MKKAFLAAAIAAFALGAAQAVTVSWTPASGNQTNNIGAFDPTETITLSVTYNISATPDTTGSGGNLFSVAWGANAASDITNNSMVLRNINGNQGANLVINAANATGETSGYVRNPVSGAFATDEHTLTIVLDLEGKTATVTLDGAETSSSLTFPTNALSFGDDLVLRTHNQTWGSVTNVEVAYSVPEPTALALLALGVAGLALRRRAA